MLFALDSHLMWVAQSQAARAANVRCIASWKALCDHADQEQSTELIMEAYCLFVSDSAR